MLARHVVQWDRATWITRADEPVPAGFAQAFDALVARRAAREPVAYIIGTREFYGRDFRVSRDVLIPRPETELIVEWALATLPADRFLRIVDVGTGSGVLAVTLAAERESWHVEAVDISERAVAVARDNARRQGVAGRLTFLIGDLLAPTMGAFDAIVANPPYVARRDAPGLSPDVHDHEPHVALFGGQDGMDVPERLLNDAAQRLVPGGWLAMEFGYGMQDPVEIAARNAGLTVVDVLEDLQGIARTLIARR
ncbi:MAG: peptide chain release factor N(5)-glutamine methyltransferase [Acidobacteria bacterium]|nr:peptide chain release factor N(5)-glutamine methyltransferase [Acidobacteriota bacterium]